MLGQHGVEMAVDGPVVAPGDRPERPEVPGRRPIDLGCGSDGAGARIGGAPLGPADEVGDDGGREGLVGGHLGHGARLGPDLADQQAGPGLPGHDRGAAVTTLLPARPAVQAEAALGLLLAVALEAALDQHGADPGLEEVVVRVLLRGGSGRERQKQGEGSHSTCYGSRPARRYVLLSRPTVASAATGSVPRASSWSAPILHRGREPNRKSVGLD